MTELPRQVLVWNRAALNGGGPTAAEGDLALAALLLAHGVVMNGGVDHALEVLSPAELAAASAGYRYFGFEQVAQLLEEAATQPDREEERLNSAYWGEIPDDEAIAHAFRKMLLSVPEAFASVTS
jgi:hypothetical protein